MLKVINREFDVEGVYSKYLEKDKVKRIYPKINYR